jgi:hypothetical protein
VNGVIDIELCQFLSGLFRERLEPAVRLVKCIPTITSLAIPIDFVDLSLVSHLRNQPRYQSLPSTPL